MLHTRQSETNRCWKYLDEGTWAPSSSECSWPGCKRILRSLNTWASYFVSLLLTISWFKENMYLELGGVLLEILWSCRWRCWRRWRCRSSSQKTPRWSAGQGSVSTHPGDPQRRKLSISLPTNHFAKWTPSQQMLCFWTHRRCWWHSTCLKSVTSKYKLCPGPESVGTLLKIFLQGISSSPIEHLRSNARPAWESGKHGNV